ncbi:protein GbdR [Marinobacterium nitratireducens]|uniref:Protein GbdR n=1 Tax=Marinobacterium nitratireducens TaxID=518897 RepID=A0A917ZLV8_9GAMM|nr:GlxA family transcriptional regulator [Marinobacterium nitratireducens]GGO84662.1 protein GbdR [Marinobacterium nitratireducens]
MHESLSGTRTSAEVKSRNIGFLLLNNFTMISLASAIEPLRMANQLSGKELYNWYTLTEDGAPVQASDGIRITPDAAMTDALELDTIIVAGGVNITRSYSKRELSWLQAMARKGRKLGGICTGAYALAEAGLLNGYECSAHWECIASLQEAYPKVNCTNRLFSVDRDRITSSGGTVPLDMMLNLIKQEHGYQLSAAISEMFICDRIRNETDHQRIPLRHVLGTTQPKLVEVVALMEANLEEAIELDELASYVGLSRRQLERLFQKYLQCSPSRYYLKLRLTRARQLLKQTSMSIIEVASACGFVSTPHFSKCYREHIGIPPREERMGMRSNRPVPGAMLVDNVSPQLGLYDRMPEIMPSTTALAALTEAQSEPSYGSVTLQ